MNRWHAGPPDGAGAAEDLRPGGTDTGSPDLLEGTTGMSANLPPSAAREEELDELEESSVGSPAPVVSPTGEPTAAAGPTGTAPGDSVVAEIPYLLAALVLVGVAVAVLEWQYSFNPVPPGVDPADWITRSYPYLHEAYPPSQAIGSPFLYPPLLFPLLAACVAITGSPLAGGLVFGGAVLAAFGVGSLILARRAFEQGPFRLAFVGLSVFNGTLLAMLFWGAYPNFLAFVFLDLGVFFLIGFLAHGRATDALGLWIAAALVYLTHSLTFDLLIGIYALAFFATLLAGRSERSWLRNRGHWAGVAVLIGTVLGYAAAERLSGISSPNYYTANPAAYVIDNLGEFFAPLARGPSIAPAGAPIYLDPHVALAILLGFGALAVLGTALLARKRADWVRPAHLAGAGWLAAVLLLPAGGYLAHIDTDYTRFLYFLPQPIAFVALLAAERSIGPRAALFEPSPAPRPRSSLGEVAARFRSRERLSASGLVVHVAVAVGLVLLLVNVTIPTAQQQEQSNTSNAHDPLFLAATSFLSSNPQSGGVLTVQGAARWVEALTARGAYDIGPTWLLFENWEITNAEETYWATNSYEAVTNNEVVYSFSNQSDSLLNQAPMYTAYVLGVAVPILRVLPGASLLNLTGTPGSPASLPVSSLGPPNLTVDPNGPPGAQSQYLSSDVRLLETVEFGEGGLSWLNVTASPNGPGRLNGLTLAFGPPPSADSSVHAPPTPTVTSTSDGFRWVVAPTLGQEPDPTTVTTTATFVPAPQGVIVNASGLPGTVTASFVNPDPGAPLHISLLLETPGTSNPGTVLPSVLSTDGFLAAFNIHFLLVPTTRQWSQNVAFFQLLFGFQVVYQNAEWLVLSR